MNKDKTEKLLKILKSSITNFLVRYGANENDTYKTITISIQAKTLKENKKEIEEENIYTSHKSISNDDFKLLDEFLHERNEEELETPSDTEKCVEPAKPDYNDLMRENQKLYDRIYQLVDETEALKWSLIKSHNEMISWKEHCVHCEENYDKEHKRAEKLYEELNKNGK